jgi:proline iminopeptidase
MRVKWRSDLRGTILPAIRKILVATALGCLFMLPTRGHATDANTPVHKYILLNGFLLHYQIVGSGSPVLILAGGPGLDAGYLTPLVNELSRRYECIVLDQRGTGRSKLPEISPQNLTLSLMVDDIEAVRKAMTINKVPIVAHSWGGMLAMEYAAKYPKRVSALVLIGSGGLDLEYKPVFYDNIESRLYPQERAEMITAEDKLKNAPDSDSALAAKLAARLPAYFYDHNIGRQFASQINSQTYRGNVLNILTPDLEAHYHPKAELRLFDGQVLIIQGHQDPMPEGVAYEIHSTMKHSELIFLDKCGHFPWLECPVPFYEAMERFLTSSEDKTHP